MLWTFTFIFELISILKSIKAIPIAFFNVGEKLVILANDEHSIFIKSIEDVQSRITVLEDRAKTYPSYIEEINELYSSILDITTVYDLGEKKGLRIQYNDIVYAFLDTDNRARSEPVVFQNINGKLKMYFSMQDFKSSILKHTKRRG